MATTSSSNFTSLYGANASPIVPAVPYGNANVVSLLAASTDGANTIGNISATGNIAGNYFLGNGSQLTGLPATYSNANVATFLAAFGSNTIVTTGNITGGYIFGNGSQLTGLPATYGNANVAANLAAFGSNPISTTGNITGGNLFGNGAGITGITVSAGTQIINGTSNVSVALNGNTTIGVANVTQAVISSQGISAVGNITGNYFLGNGSQLTGVTAANSAVYLRDASNAAAYVNVDNSLKIVNLPGGGFISYTGDAADPNTFGSVDIVNPQANLANAYSALTFVNAANFAANPLNTVNVSNGGIFVAYDLFGTNKNYNVGPAGVVTNTTLSAAGNITAPYFLGNGSQLTGLPATYGNANVASLLAGFGSNAISTTGNVTATNFIGNGAGLTNITVSGGTQIINGTSNVSVATNANTTVGVAGTTVATFSSTGMVVPGTVTAQTLVTSGVTGNITGVNYLVANIVNTTGVISAGGNITGSNIVTGGTASATGTITGGNLVTGGLISATGNITGGNVATAGLITATGNITGGNVSTAGLITATGTITGGNVATGGTASVTGNITGGNVSTAGLITATGNITGGNVSTAGLITATGNITGGNLRTGGLISATGNISGNYFVGNGSALTGVTAVAANSATFLTSSSNAAAFVSVDSANTQTVLPGNGRIGYGGDGVDPNTFGSINIIPAQANLAVAYSSLTFLNLANFLANPINAVNVGNTGSQMQYDIVGGFGGSKSLNLSALGVTTDTTISATGNITAPYFLGNGSALTGIVATVVGTLASLSVTGNVDAGNLRTAGQVSATGTITGGNLATGGTTSAVGNITGGNIVTGGTASAAGTITGGNIVSGGTVSATGNITGGNVATSGTTSAAGNITGGNLVTGGQVIATGNITGGNITGVSGSVATGIINYKDYVATITYAATITPNIALGSIQQVTLTGNVTMNAFGGTPQAGQSMVIKFIQDATGGRTLTSTMKWAGGVKTLTGTANAVDIASVFYDGTTYYASLTNNYS